MNKIGQYLYNAIFWISRFITLSIFGIYFFVVLNIKYVWSETFFTKLINSSLYVSYFIHSLIDFNNISNILTSSFYTAQNLINSNNISGIITTSFYPAPAKIFETKYKLFSNFCINIQQADVLLLTILLILLISICIKIFIKKSSIYYNLIIIFVIYLLLYLYTSLTGIFFLPLMTLFIFLTAIVANKWTKIKKIIQHIPIISELFCIDLILNKILNRTIDKQKITFIILMEALICSNMLYFITPFRNDNFINKIIDNSVYSISFLNDKIMLATSPITILYDDDSYFSINNANFNFQNIIINNHKKEIYIYDDKKEKLIFLNIDSLKVIDTLDFQSIESGNNARICCNNSMSKLLIAFEDSNSGAYLIDLNNHTVIGKYQIDSPSDYVVYNKYRNSFIITFFLQHGFMQEIKCDNSKNVEVIDSDSFQGYICISNRNKEVYVAFHQQGRIGVYDAQTMKLKRKIKSNYTVKDITYDEELNVLIAPSYFTGYVDIFLMDGTDKLLTREFVGYELREARFDSKKENLYICSRNGLYKKKIDVKKLIANVSHETK